MKQDGRLEIRLNKQIKQKFNDIAARQGVDSSAVLCQFAEEVVQKGRIPLPIVTKCRAKRKRRDRLLSFDQIVIAVNRMATAFGQDEIQKIYLFGSYSRGEATVKSDVDFFILVGKEISFMRRAEFNGLLRNALGKSVDTLFSDDRIPDEVLQNIQKDKRLVYEFQSR